MKDSLLEILVCPSCRERFELHANERTPDGEVETGQIECTGCGATYPILRSIPRILPASQVSDNYSRNFQHYWLTMDWHRPELTKRRLYELTEWTQEDIRGKYILDAGCGGGRWVYQFAEEGAREIVAFDYTLAIERAREICSGFKNIHYVQADLYHIPLPDNLFDVVHCHGVLMATPDPRTGIERLSEKVRPGGQFAILLYRNLTRAQKAFDDAVCGLTKRLPTRFAYRLTALFSAIEYVPGAVPLLENVIHLSGQPDFTLKHLHNFDWFTCAFRHRNSPAEVAGWLKSFGFTDVKVLNTNEFRVRSRFRRIREWKEKALERGLFLKATLGMRATKLQAPDTSMKELLAYRAISGSANSEQCR